MAKDMRTQPTSPNSIPTSQLAGFFKKKAVGRRRPARAAAAGSLFFEKCGRLGCGDGIRRCKLCSHILCHQFQPMFNPFSLNINKILLESTQNLKKPTTLKTNFPSSDRGGGTQRATSCLQLMSKAHIGGRRRQPCLLLCRQPQAFSLRRCGSE